MAIELSENYLAKKQERPAKETSSYVELANRISLAKEVRLAANNREYKGKVESLKAGKLVVFKVNNIDQNLLGIYHGHSFISLRLITSGGMAKEFPVKIITAKMPRILLTFPEGEKKKLKRSEERFETSLDTIVTLYKRENTILHGKHYGRGKVKNLSINGCSIAISLDLLREDDKIEYFIQAVEEGENKLLKMTGIVRSVHRKADGAFIVGVKHYHLDETAEESLASYIKHRKDMALGLAS